MSSPCEATIRALGYLTEDNTLKYVRGRTLAHKDGRTDTHTHTHTHTYIHTCKQNLCVHRNILICNTVEI